MATKVSRKIIRTRIKNRYRHKLLGDATIPRLSVYRSLRYISVQAVDDTTGVIISSASSLDKTIAKALSGSTANIKAAKMVGEAIAEKLTAKKIKTARFDRNGFLYHGAIKSVAEAIREKGIKI